LLETILRGIKEVKEMIFAYPKLGYKFSGFISINDDITDEDEIGLLKDLHEIVGERNIDEVIIASDHKYEELIISTLNVCSNLNVSVKIVPEVYEIVSGMVKSEQVHGIPLVEVKTELMPFTFQWYTGLVPGLVGVAVNVTGVPAQILS